MHTERRGRTNVYRARVAHAMYSLVSANQMHGSNHMTAGTNGMYINDCVHACSYAI